GAHRSRHGARRRAGAARRLTGIRADQGGPRVQLTFEEQGRTMSRLTNPSRRRLREAAVAALAIAAAMAGAAPVAHALDNGLARTPPMGFNEWNAFGCNVSEQLIEQTADFFVSSGMRDAGYQYVNIDDCWMTDRRDAQGRLVPDPVKFP